MFFLLSSLLITRKITRKKIRRKYLSRKKVENDVHHTTCPDITVNNFVDTAPARLPSGFRADSIPSSDTLHSGAALFPRSFSQQFRRRRRNLFFLEVFLFFALLCFSLLYFSLCAYFGEKVHHERLSAGKSALKTVLLSAIPEGKQE